MAPTVDGADSAERFPCEGCPCGCGTAAHCWAKCCCHTLPQRLAWARREGVRPPEAILDQAAAAGHDVADWRPDAAYRVRLPESLEARASQTETVDLEELPACCRARVARAAKPRAAETPVEPRATPGVSLLQALACQGLAEAWLSLGEAPLMALPEVVAGEGLTTVGDFSAPLWCHVDEAPTPPPPETSASFIS